MTEPTPQEQINRLITGYWASQAIYAAAKFGIADLLNDGPRSVDALAEASSTNADALYRLLRALASIGVFEEHDERTFSLTPLAETLRSDIRGSQRALAMMSGDEFFLAWSEIAHSIQTGETAFGKVFGKPVFEYLGQNPEKGRIFDEAMTGIHGRETSAVLDAYDFSGIEVLADVGGGNGSNIAAILEKHPAMTGILFDLAPVVERADARIRTSRLSERCQLVAGNFFVSVPQGADAYLMRHIIHDWDDERSLRILRNCHTAMPDGGKLLVIESVIPPGNDPFAGKFLDLVMLLIPGGRERTEQEYRLLFEKAGFELTRIVPTRTEMSIVEGVRR